MANVADIITEYGAYYEKGPQNKDRIIKMLMQPSETAQEFKTVITDDTLWKGASAQIGSVLQAFHKNFTAKGQLTFAPRPIQNFHLKVDFAEFPDDIEATWLGFLADSSLSRKEWPLVRYIIEVFLMDKIDEDFELNEAFNGVFTAPNGTDAGDDGESMDGLKKIQDDGVTAGDINEVTTGAITSANCLAKSIVMADALDAKFKKVPMTLYMSPENETFFKDLYLSAYGTNLIIGQESKLLTVPNRNIKVKGLASMAGSDRMWMTPDWNKVRLLKKSVNKYNFEIQSEKRQVVLLSDWWECLNYHIPQYVWVNDQN